ncbi:MAG TPA: hypothetical protein VK619_16345 [Pyrinomonadaceae bacterium]|nr:hypothetical protein [Pyrinomonadaceae bacterium]
MAVSNEKVEGLLRDLPDAEGACLFYERLAAEEPRAARALARNAALLSDALALAAWSPLLGATLLQNPDYIQWLARERQQVRVKTREELGEALGRFALTNSQLDPHLLLSRFRRRELLRVYLHDIRRISTVVETTEELSNLADAVLEYALGLARAALDNRYGAPLSRGEKGRISAASFCVVALGKLGSRELNYASDIDLFFLFSDEGTTSGHGERGLITNREYFVKLAQEVTRIVGQTAGEGAAYRVDLRLRPYGRDGALASSLDEAVRYYSESAQAWELQALIRSRASAGSEALFARFAERVRDHIFRPDVTIADALRDVRLAKQKIDRKLTQDSNGFNVKLGRGGIREIEFIAQALSLAYGGSDAWLRAPHTLIGLSRIADRQLITKSELTELSDAYSFLRALEHRLQMEHGLQTHSVPVDTEKRATIARRMNFSGADALNKFDLALELHTSHVRAAFERVFESTQAHDSNREPDARSIPTAPCVHQVKPAQPLDAESLATQAAARVFAQHLVDLRAESESALIEETEETLREAARTALNSHRALMTTARIAASLEKSSEAVKVSKETLSALVRICGASEFFGEMVACHPELIALAGNARLYESKHASRASAGNSLAPTTDYRTLLFEAVEQSAEFRSRLSALRKVWAGLLFEIGALDSAGKLSMFEANARQTELAEASLDGGLKIARDEFCRKFDRLDAEPRMAVLGLGRLGGRGVDYGSDLDVVLVYDEDWPSPLKHLTHKEAYARMAELLVTALSGMTRDRYLYRVDLRLRPDGKNGATVSGARAFLDYLENRSVAWEWLAYVKLRAAAGEIALGSKIEEEARRIVHSVARVGSREDLRAETLKVRERLEIEKTDRRARHVDIKFGPGGMLDVYFATRYLQLRDDVPDDRHARSTRATLERLHDAGSLAEEDFTAMNEGYALLRKVDHALRLVIGRATRLPAAGRHALADIAHAIGYASAETLIADLATHMKEIRAAYERTMKKVVQNAE